MQKALIQPLDVLYSIDADDVQDKIVLNVLKENMKWMYDNITNLSMPMRIERLCYMKQQIDALIEDIDDHICYTYKKLHITKNLLENDAFTSNERWEVRD